MAASADSESPSSDVSASVLNGTKNTSKKKKPLNLRSLVALPSNDTVDLFKRAKRKKEEKLQDQLNG